MSRSLEPMAQTGRRPLRVLISAGPTREPLDPVRFLSNYSTGYMGSQVAAEALRRGHRVTVVLGPSSEPMPVGARVIPVERTSEMERALQQQAAAADVVIMAAAVADFRPARVATAKLARRRRILRLEATPDILGSLPRKAGQLLVGFALESNSVVSRARRKLRAKRLDLLLAQQAPPPGRLVGGQANGHDAPPHQTSWWGGAPFGRRPVRAWLLGRGGFVADLGRLTKPRVARALLDKTEALWYGQRRSSAHKGAHDTHR